jgi:hypothetical protein
MSARLLLLWLRLGALSVVVALGALLAAMLFITVIVMAFPEPLRIAQATRLLLVTTVTAELAGWFLLAVAAWAGLTALARAFGESKP